MEYLAKLGQYMDNHKTDGEENSWSANYPLQLPKIEREMCLISSI